MAKEYSLDLYQNAIDSLNEGMNFYKKSIDDKSKYKFCIMIISNFMELMLKCMVEKQHHLLCYERPHSDKLSKEKTITWRQALQILLNSNIVVKKDLRDGIDKLTEFRNKIMHYKFDYNTSEIRSIIVTVINGLRKLYNDIFSRDFIDDASDDSKDILKSIEGEYFAQLHLAQAEAKEEANENELNIADCLFCGESETAVERKNNETYCHFCEETDYEAECCRCTEMFKVSELEYFGQNDYGDDLYFCEYCSGLLNGDD